MQQGITRLVRRRAYETESLPLGPRAEERAVPFAHANGEGRLNPVKKVATAFGNTKEKRRACLGGDIPVVAYA